MTDETISGEKNPLAYAVEALIWIKRAIVASALLLVWAFLALGAICYFSSSSLGRGIEFEFDVRWFLFVLTAVYFAASAPVWMLPTRQGEWFTLFQSAATGWMLCLAGSLAYLPLAQAVRLSDMRTPANEFVFYGVVGVLFVASAFAGWLAPVSNARRSFFAVLCFAGLIGWLIVARSLLAQPGFPGYKQFGVLLGVLLYLVVTASLSLTMPTDFAINLMSLLALLWLFIGVGFIFLQIRQDRYVLLGAAGSFVGPCIMMTAILAPFFTWVGSAPAKTNRVGWALLVACLTIGSVYNLAIRPAGAYGLVADIDDEESEDDEKPTKPRQKLEKKLSLLSYICENYRGAHMSPR